jgi:carbonic anhydrase
MTSGRILDQHEVGAAVVACIDFRFRENLASAIHTTFGIDAYDEIKLAGGAKNFSRPGKPGRHETALHDLELAINAHHANTVILLTHQNCGKYASEGHSFTDAREERKFHTAELRTAGEIVRTQFPNVTVLLGYTYVSDADAVQIERIPF